MDKDFDTNDRKEEIDDDEEFTLTRETFFKALENVIDQEDEELDVDDED